MTGNNDQEQQKGAPVIKSVKSEINNKTELIDVILAFEVASSQLRYKVFPYTENKFTYTDIPMEGRFWRDHTKAYPVNMDDIKDITIEEAIWDIIVAKQEKYTIKAIAIAFRGAVHNGVIIHTHRTNAQLQNNFHLQNNLKLRFMSKNHVAPEIFIENRSNMGAYGELYYNPEIESQNHSNFIYITIEGMLGAGVVIDKKLYLGKSGFAGEVGHIVLDSGSSLKCDVCNQDGCAAALTSGKAMVRQAIEQSQSNDTWVINAINGRALETYRTIDSGYWLDLNPLWQTNNAISVKDVLEASHNSETPRRIVEAAIGNFKKLLANIMYIYNPECILIGGSITDNAIFNQQVAVNQFPNVPAQIIPFFISPAALGDESALIGVGKWAFDHLMAKIMQNKNQL